MKRKKLVSSIVSVVMVMCLTVTALAAYSLFRQAKASLFTGRVAYSFGSGGTTVTDDNIKLSLELDGKNLGNDAGIGCAGNSIPMLGRNVTSSDIGNNTWVWKDEEGNVALKSNQFVLTAEGSEFINLNMDLSVTGDMIDAAALRFGIAVTYYDEKEGTRLTHIFGKQIQHIDENGATTYEMPLGDGNIAAGEKIGITVAVWADGDALYQSIEKAGGFENAQNGSISIQALFSGNTPES